MGGELVGVAPRSGVWYASGRQRGGKLMARRTAGEMCMFCAPDAPCATHAPKQKAAPKKKPAASKVVRVGKPEAVVAVEADVYPVPVTADPPPTPVPRKAAVHAAMRAHIKPSAPPAPAPVIEPDPVIDDAIRALAPILHPVERREHEAILSQPRTVEVRIAAWREKRRGTA